MPMVSHKERLVVPKAGASSETLQQFMERGCDRSTSRYIELDSENLVSLAYTQGHQWINRERSSGTNRLPRISTLQGAGSVSREGIPMPIDNQIFPAIDNEVSRLSKRNSEVYVDPRNSADPSSKAAAKVANDSLLAHLEDIRWNRIRRRVVYRSVVYGTTILRSYLEQDNLDTVRIGITTAAKCAGRPPVQSPTDEMGRPYSDPGMEPCGYTLAEPTIPEDETEWLKPDQLSRVKEKAGFDFEEKKATKTVTATSCVTCGCPMQPFVPTGDEVHGQDAYGRPLGQDVPRGKAMVEDLSPFEVFFQNEGIGVEPESFEECWIQKPRSIDWVKRYYRKNVEQVKPDDPQTIAEASPILGEYGAGSKGSAGVNAREVYHNHVLVREYLREKCMDYPMGRHVVMAGNVVLVDGDLYVQPKGQPGKAKPKPIPKVKVAVARGFYRDGEIWGQGAPNLVISLQNRINMTHSQIVDTRERHGVAGILATRGMRLEGLGWIRGFVGRILHWEPDPLNMNLKPEPFETRLMPEGAWKEIEYCKTAIAVILGMMDVEVGQAPPGIQAYSAIALMAEKASERRQQRERELIDLFEEIFSHQLALKAHFYREPREYRVKGENGWEVREFVGADLGGERGAKVREQPSFDKSTAEREALAGQMENPIFAAAFASPHASKEMGRILGVPESVLQQSNLQLESAQRKWFDFLRKGIVPVVDDTLDDAWIHYQETGRLMLSQEGIELAQKAGWPFLRRTLGDWERKLNDAIAAVAAYPQQVAGYEQQMAAIQAGQPQVDPLTLAPLPAPVAPEPPFGGQPFPELEQDKILFVWQQTLMEKGAQLPPEAGKFLEYRAVYEAYRRIDEQKKAAAAGGMAEAAAPQGGMTPEGQVPTAGQPALPAPGSGQVAA